MCGDGQHTQARGQAGAQERAGDGSTKHSFDGRRPTQASHGKRRLEKGLALCACVATGYRLATVATKEQPKAGGLKLRRSLAARISALVFLMFLAAGGSALVMQSQLQSVQDSFDRLTAVYVVFNQRLATAHVQAVRVYEQVRTHQNQDAELQRPEPAFLANFEIALRARSELVAEAREPVDLALREPERFGAAQLVVLGEIRTALDELQELAERDEMAEPGNVLGQVQTHSRISQLFVSLAGSSRKAVDELGRELASEREDSEQRTLLLVAAVALLGGLASAGLFLTLRPLRRLTQKVRDLGRGDWAQRVETEGGRGDEVSGLADEFNLMAEALQERERRLLRGERLAAAGQLAAQITHEIRNPLSSVALNIELLEDEFESATPEARHLLKEITKELDRLTAVTEDYLRFARRPKPELVALDLREELQGLLDFMAPELEFAGVEVHSEFPAEAAHVRGDPNQLRQVFMNLIRNAREAALDESCDEEQTPRVAVEMRCKDEGVVVVVRDNGPGIDLPVDQFERIFEAFYTRKAQGTGLGLPTVQQILADHGGAVRVAQSSPAGTVFEAVIPAAGAHSPPVEPMLTD